MATHTIQNPPWYVLGTGDHVVHLAPVAATNGKFVIGARRAQSPGRGHVAVIVDTNYSSNTFPHRTEEFAYWNSLESESEQASENRILHVLRI